MTNNSRLVNMVKLSSKITVYVPSTTDINITIDNTKYIENVGTVLSDCFGGATASSCMGMWVSPTCGLVRENTTMVFAYCTDSGLKTHINTVIDMCENLKSELRQDAIALEINGEMYFV